MDASESGLRSLQLPSGTQLEAVKKSAKVAADQQGRQLPRVGATFWAPFGPSLPHVSFMFLLRLFQMMADFAILLVEDGSGRHRPGGE